MGDGVHSQHPDEAHSGSGGEAGYAALEVQQLRQQLYASQAAHRAAAGMAAAHQQALQAITLP